MYSAVPNFLLISSMTGGFTTFCGTCAPGHFNVNDFQVADDLNWVKGRHQIGFGFNVIRVQNNTISGFDENGAPAWNGQFTGLGMADFMLGKMSDFQQTNATPDDLRTWIMSFYAQDSFRINNHFTLNFGLRWEPTFSDPDKYRRGNSFIQSAFLAGQVSTLHPTAPAGLFFPGDPGIPAANWSGQKANFAPRVGLVWNPSGEGKDTLRIGAALLYDSAETWFNERETTNPPFGNDIDVGAATLSNPWAGFRAGIHFPSTGISSSPPRAFTSPCLSIPSPPTWALGMSPISGRSGMTGWSPQATWAIRPPTFGSLWKGTPISISPGTAPRVNTASRRRARVPPPPQPITKPGGCLA